MAAVLQPGTPPSSTADTDADVGALVTAGSIGPDEFETRALVFISQQDASARALLTDIVALRRLTSEAKASIAVELAAQAAALAEESGAKGAEGIEARIHSALQLHGIDENFGHAWCEGREWRALRAPLVECVLNWALQMFEMLSEERSNALRKAVAARMHLRVRRRFRQAQAWTEPNEEWGAQLADWQALLRPFPWNRVRSQVMSQVLQFADLREPLTQHVRLVRSYEFLRCLGVSLLGGETSRPKQLELLQAHGRQFGCWREGEVDNEALAAYLASVVAPGNVPAAPSEVRKEDLAQLGFTPAAVRGRGVPAVVLGHLAKQLLARVGDELRELCGRRGLHGALAAGEALAEHARGLADQAVTAPEQWEESEGLRDFLLAVSEDLVQRALSSQDGPKPVNFELLASGDARFASLHALEEQAEARRLLDDMALNELVDLLELILEASAMVHGPGCADPALEAWHARLDRLEDSALHPAEIGELSAALQSYLQANQRSRKTGEEDGLPACVARALGGACPGHAHAPADASDAVTPEGAAYRDAPQPGAARKVIACFGAHELAQEQGPNVAKVLNPVVVRAVPLGLGAVGEDYEVREVGIRIGGMYISMAHDPATEHNHDSDVVVMHYQWVPPGQVREDSKPLQQILGSATHVRLLLAEKDGSAEERKVDLQTCRVHSDSAWYRAIPSRPRSSADENGGFRRFVLEVGRGLRLPLPSGLVQVPAGGGVVETADVLAHVLALWFSQRHAREDMTAALRQRPALLYFASTALFECFDHLAPKFMQALGRHWASVLGIILYYTILYYTILYYTILYYTITILYYTILYYTILYYTILYYTILYYTILYSIVYHTIPCYCMI